MVLVQWFKKTNGTEHGSEVYPDIHVQFIFNRVNKGIQWKKGESLYYVAKKTGPLLHTLIKNDLAMNHRSKWIVKCVSCLTYYFLRLLLAVKFNS